MDMIYGGDQLLLVPTVCFQYRRHSNSASSAKLVDGSRFDGERELLRCRRGAGRALGWRRAKRAARLQAHVPGARALACCRRPSVRRDKSAAVSALVRHSFGT